MVFTWAGKGGNCRGCEWISAIGVIGPETPHQLREFLAKQPRGVQWIVSFDSPGGNLAAGLELGRVIRDAGLATDVGETEVPDASHPRHDTRPGLCLGACAYAFAGGIDRSISKGSRLGFPNQDVRRSSFGISGFDATNPSAAEVTEGDLAAYLVHMGVDARLLMVPVAKGGQLVFLSGEEMTKLDLLTPAGWSPPQMQPLGVGLVVSAKLLDPDTSERGITLYCTSSNAQPYVALSLDRPSDMNPDETYTRADFVAAIQQATVQADDKTYAVPAQDLLLSYAPGLYVLSLPLPPTAAHSLLGATKLAVTIDAPQAFLDLSPTASLGLRPDDRRMIGLAFRNCISNDTVPIG